MNREKKGYTKFALSREMMETPGIIERFDFSRAPEAEKAVAQRRRVFFSGEGSSRIFPAKHFIYQSLRSGSGLHAATDGSRQAAEYDLSDFAVFAASNSGKTKEVVLLLRELKARGHTALFSLSAFPDTPLGQAATVAYVLSCGKEAATAATKSVVEQALFYHAILDRVTGARALPRRARELADKFSAALSLPIPSAILKKLTAARVIHWSGRNTGAAEELTLKTNEITRKRSAYLEGTYAVHGVEEVMSPEDAVIILDPFEAEEEKFEEVLVKGVGLTVVAIASRETRFPTIRVPAADTLDNYVHLAAGWNLLVEIGLALGVNLDKAERARKVGNVLVE
jgi:glucosamine--fructose-6-phosphate aminotransferase (isomerizing)